LTKPTIHHLPFKRRLGQGEAASRSVKGGAEKNGTLIAGCCL